VAILPNFEGLMGLRDGARSLILLTIVRRRFSMVVLSKTNLSFESMRNR